MRYVLRKHILIQKVSILLCVLGSVCVVIYWFLFSLHHSPYVYSLTRSILLNWVQMKISLHFYFFRCWQGRKIKILLWYLYLFIAATKVLKIYKFYDLFEVLAVYAFLLVFSVTILRCFIYILNFFCCNSLFKLFKI